MSKKNLGLGVAAAAIMLAVLAGCSKPDQAPADQVSAPPLAVAPASEAAAPSPTTQVGPGKVKLDIKASAAGEAIHGDPANGRSVFNQCMSCHSREPGVNTVGPSLHGVIGRPAGQVAGFKYSAANKASGLVWTEQELYAYLENPQKVMPGTYMTYTGVKDPQKRADLIAFLRENTK